MDSIPQCQSFQTGVLLLSIGWQIQWGLDWTNGNKRHSYFLLFYVVSAFFGKLETEYRVKLNLSADNRCMKTNREDPSYDIRSYFIFTSSKGNKGALHQKFVFALHLRRSYLLCLHRYCSKNMSYHDLKTNHLKISEKSDQIKPQNEMIGLVNLPVKLHEDFGFMTPLLGRTQYFLGDVVLTWNCRITMKPTNHCTKT